MPLPHCNANFIFFKDFSVFSGGPVTGKTDVYPVSPKKAAALRQPGCFCFRDQ
jgi:cytochrome c oxidase assembly protein Cox11